MARHRPSHPLRWSARALPMVLLCGTFLLLGFNGHAAGADPAAGLEAGLGLDDRVSLAGASDLPDGEQGAGCPAKKLGALPPAAVTLAGWRPDWRGADVAPPDLLRSGQERHPSDPDRGPPPSGR